MASINDNNNIIKGIANTSMIPSIFYNKNNNNNSNITGPSDIASPAPTNDNNTVKYYYNIMYWCSSTRVLIKGDVGQTPTISAVFYEHHNKLYAFHGIYEYHGRSKGGWLAESIRLWLDNN
eukprot:493986_1